MPQAFYLCSSPGSGSCWVLQAWLLPSTRQDATYPPARPAGRNRSKLSWAELWLRSVKITFGRGCPGGAVPT